MSWLDGIAEDWSQMRASWAEQLEQERQLAEANAEAIYAHFRWIQEHLGHRIVVTWQDDGTSGLACETCRDVAQNVAQGS